MINSKLEKVLLVLVWYALLVIFRFILPISEPPNYIDKYVVVFVSVVVTVVVCRIYIYYRNKRVLKNINFLLETNQSEEVMKYINTCLEKHKKSRSIYMYKLYAVAMCGGFAEFEEMLSICEISNEYNKLITLDFVVGLKNIINYFKTGNCTTIFVMQGFWGEIVNVLSEKDYNKNIPVLLNMYNTNFAIIKTVLAFKLYLTYLEINSIEKAEYYYNEALKYAPSLEVAYCIESARKGTRSC